MLFSLNTPTLRTLALSAVVVANLSACSEEDMRPQSYPAQPQPVAAEPAEPELAPVPKHNLGRIADSGSVTPEQLAALKVGVTTEAEVLQLLGEAKPFALGDGKHILRYDVGKFIFDANKILIRKFLN